MQIVVIFFLSHKYNWKNAHYNIYRYRNSNSRLSSKQLKKEAEVGKVNQFS